MKKVLSLLLVIALALSVFTGCKEEKKEPVFPVTVEGVEIAAAPQKAVIMSPGIAVVAVRLGYIEQIAGICEDNLNPTSLRNTPLVGDAITPDVAKIIELEADMYISFMAPTDQDRAELEKNGVKIITLTCPTDIESMAAYYANIAACFEGVIDVEHEANTYTKDIEAWVAKIAEGQTKLPSYAVISSAKMFGAGGDTIESSLFGSILGKNVLQDKEGYTFAMEEIIRKDPDVLIVTDSLSMELLQGTYGISGLSAVKEGKVYFVNLKNFELMLPELFVQMCEVAQKVYAE